MRIAEISTQLQVDVFLLVLAIGGLGFGLLARQRGRGHARTAAGANPATGALGSGVFERELRREAARAKRSGEPLSVVLFEFHDASARSIGRVVREWRDDVRGTDEIGHVDERRVGLLLPACGRAGAQSVIRRLDEAEPSVERRAGSIVYDGTGEPGALLRSARRAVRRSESGLVPV